MYKVYLNGYLAVSSTKKVGAINREFMHFITTSCLSDEWLEASGRLLIKTLEKRGGVLSYPVCRLYQTSISLPQNMWLGLREMLEDTSQSISLRERKVYVMWALYGEEVPPFPGTRVVGKSEGLSLEVRVMERR